MIPYKKRKLDKTKPVYIYRNLRGNDAHKYSVKQGGLVIGHTHEIMVHRVRFIVNTKGQARVRATKRKNVHAYIKGMVQRSGMGIAFDSGRKLPAIITYDPYKDKTFVCKNLTIKPFPVLGASVVIINEHGVTAAYTEKT